MSSERQEIELSAGRRTRLSSKGHFLLEIIARMSSNIILLVIDTQRDFHTGGTLSIPGTVQLAS